MIQERQAMDSFYKDLKEEKDDAEAKKPAFFQKKDESSGKEDPWAKLRQQIKMDFDPAEKSDEELREFFKLSKDKNAIEHMNEQVFDFLFERMKDRQVRFYAFLNKEFNVMNFKSARCSMHCFNSTERNLGEINNCLGVCR